MTEWRTIDNPPKDGRYQIVYGYFKTPVSITNGFDIATFSNFTIMDKKRPSQEKWCCEIDDPDKKVTHWMPLPNPPLQTKE